MRLNKISPMICSYKNRLTKTFLLFLIILPSCVTQRNIEYLQDRNQGPKEFNEAEFPDYMLKPNDELYIQISSLDEGTANVFSNSVSQTSFSSGSMQPYGASLMSYSIDKDGRLLLPVIGNIFVRDKTLSQVSLILKDSLRNILSQPVVTVKLVNRYVSVLGEARNPGHYPYSQEKLSIFDAIGLAGDVNDFGNRNKVILVRNENGMNIRVNLDLTTSEILSSGFYYIRPNDLIYIKPLRNKFWGLRQIPITVLLSAITTGLLIYNVTK